MTTLGVIRGQIILDARQALATYSAVRLANLKTVTALNRGAAVMRAAGTAMLGGGLLLGAGLGLAVKKAADFEKQMDFVGAVTNTSAEEMKKLSDKALQLGADTRYSANEIAESFIELGKAGVSAKEMIDGIGEAVASLGAAADIPLTDAANIITSSVKTFGLAASDATGVADKLAGAANASMVEVADLGVTLKYAGGVAASLGVEFNELNTATALLGKYGIRGSTAGTSLRQMLIGLGGSTKKATAMMKELGIITADGSNKFYDASGKMKPLPQVLDILNDSTKNLTQKDKVKALQTMFNVRSLPTVLNLMKEGTKGFNEMSEAISKTTAADVAAKRMDNLSGDVEILRGNIDTLLIQAGTPFQEFLRGIVQRVTQVVQWFGNLSPATQQLIMKIIAFTAAGLILMGTLTFIVGTGLRFISMLMDLKAVFGLLKNTLGIATKAMKAFSLSMLTNPVFLIIAAIALLVVGFIILWKRSERFRNFMKGLWSGIKSAWDATLNWIKGLPEWFGNLWDSIKDKTSAAWNAIINFFTVTIPQKLGQAWEGVKSTTSTAWESIVAFFAALPGRIGAFFTALGNNIVAFFVALPGRIGFALGFLLGIIVGFFANLYIYIYNKAGQIITAVVQWFAQLPGRIATWLSATWTWVQMWWNRIKTTAISLASQLINGVVRFFQQLPGRISALLSSAYNWVTTKFSQMKARAVALTAQLVSGVVNFFQQLPMRVATFLTNMVSKAQQKFTEMKNKAREMAVGVYNTISDWIGKIPGLVTGIVGKTVSAFKEMVTGAFNAAKDFAKGLWDGFKKGLGINSPSLIEKQMVQITDVTGDETSRLKRQVEALQGVSKTISGIPFKYTQEFELKKEGVRNLANTLASDRAAIKELVGISASRTPAMRTSQTIDPNTGRMISTLDGLLAEAKAQNLKLGQERDQPTTLRLNDGTELKGYLKREIKAEQDELIRKVHGR